MSGYFLLKQFQPYSRENWDVIFLLKRWNIGRMSDLILMTDSFPTQDTLPQGGFGNLIALPLQKKARDLGNSVFVNEDLIAYEDQWGFLSSLSKITRQDVEWLYSFAIPSRGCG